MRRSSWSRPLLSGYDCPVQANALVPGSRPASGRGPGAWAELRCGVLGSDAQETVQQSGDVAQQVAEQVTQSATQQSAVQQPGNSTEQVAEQVSCAGDRLNQQIDRVQRNPQTQDVEIQRPQIQRQDAASTRRWGRPNLRLRGSGSGGWRLVA